MINKNEGLWKHIAEAAYEYGKEWGHGIPEHEEGKNRDPRALLEGGYKEFAYYLGRENFPVVDWMGNDEPLRLLLELCLKLCDVDGTDELRALIEDEMFRGAWDGLRAELGSEEEEKNGF